MRLGSPNVSCQINLIEEVFDYHIRLVTSYSDLRQDLDRGLSIIHSKVNIEAWEIMASRIGNEEVAKSANALLGRVIPRLFINWGKLRRAEFEIHLVIENVVPRMTFNLMKSRTVPFKSDLGTKEIVVPDMAQVISVDMNSVYRFPWERLSAYQMYDHTYYSDRTELEADSSGRCVEVITSSHMSDLAVFRRCTMLDAEDTFQLIILIY